MANLPVVYFNFSHKKCHYQSRWIHNFLFFFSYFGFISLLGNFEHHCLSAIQIFSDLAAIARENSVKKKTMNWEWLRLCCSFINLTEWPKRQVICQQLIGFIKHKWTNILFFSCVLLQLFSGLEIDHWKYTSITERSCCQRRWKLFILSCSSLEG